MIMFWFHHNIAFKNYLREFWINSLVYNIFIFLRGTSLLTYIESVFLFFCFIIYLLQVWREMFFSKFCRFNGIVNAFTILRRTCDIFLQLLKPWCWLTSLTLFRVKLDRTTPNCLLLFFGWEILAFVLKLNRQRMTFLLTDNIFAKVLSSSTFVHAHFRQFYRLAQCTSCLLRLLFTVH